MTALHAHRLKRLMSVLAPTIVDKRPRLLPCQAIGHMKDVTRSLPGIPKHPVADFCNTAIIQRLGRLLGHPIQVQTT